MGEGGEILIIFNLSWLLKVFLLLNDEKFFFPFHVFNPHINDDFSKIKKFFLQLMPSHVRVLQEIQSKIKHTQTKVRYQKIEESKKVEKFWFWLKRNQVMLNCLKVELSRRQSHISNFLSLRRATLWVLDRLETIRQAKKFNLLNPLKAKQLLMLIIRSKVSLMSQQISSDSIPSTAAWLLEVLKWRREFTSKEKSFMSINIFEQKEDKKIHIFN